MSLEFTPIQLDRRPAYINRLASCPVAPSDLSFINLWAWADVYGLEWAWDSESVWIRQTGPEVCYWPPAGPWHRMDWNALLKRHIDRPCRFVRMPEQLVAIWQQQGLPPGSTIEETRKHWDYIYPFDALLELKGRKLHKKKNLLNQFKKAYDYRYEPLSDQSIYMASKMQQNWCVWRDCESSEMLAAENRAIERVFNHWEQLADIIGGCVFVDQEIIAYTLAEPLSTDTLLIHFEKADPEYKGSYQAVQQLFLSSLNHPYIHVNREQDLGDPGLRKAKLSYDPIAFVRKFRIDISNGEEKQSRR